MKEKKFIYGTTDVDVFADPKALHPVEYIEPVRNSEDRDVERIFSRVIIEIFSILLTTNNPVLAAECLAYAFKVEHLLDNTNRSVLARKHGIHPNSVYDRISGYERRISGVLKELNDV